LGVGLIIGPALSVGAAARSCCCQLVVCVIRPGECRDTALKRGWGLMNLLNKAKSMLFQNKDKAKDAVDKAGDVVDEKTGSKYAHKVDMAPGQGQGPARPGRC
jgi:MT0933-like antitoxin protein